MVLTVEICNSEIILSLYRNRERVQTFHLSSELHRTDCEYAVLIHQLFGMKGIREQELEGAVIASVVPPLTVTVKNALSFLCPELKIYIVGPGLKTGLNIKIENPADLGADLAAAAVGTLSKYPVPALIICLGTATKMLVLNDKKQFIGGTILPGVLLSLKGLTGKTAQLPTVSLTGSVKLISSNTQESVRSGVILGHAAMIDGMIERYRGQMGDFTTVVACGRASPDIIPYCTQNITLDPYLLHDGLLAIYEKNVSGSHK